MRETIGTGSTAKILDFVYDNNGQPFTLCYSTDGGETFLDYFYITNMQGDVVRLVDSVGTTVANYSYDAWGNLLSASGTMAIMNPLRYRGYYYDTETGFYYVSSRYYDPEVGRFISPDTTDVLTATPAALTDKNLYAYCDNNPVVRADYGGNFWHIIAGGIIGGVVSAAVTMASQYVTEGKIHTGEVLRSAFFGMATGALSAAGVPLGVMVAVNGITSAGESLINDIGTNKSIGKRIANAAVSGGMSALFTYVGGSSNGKQMNAMYKANKEATKNILAGGLHPKVKSAAYNTIKTYYKALGRFIVSDARDSLLNSSFNSFSTEIYKKAVEAYIK